MKLRILETAQKPNSARGVFIAIVLLLPIVLQAQRPTSPDKYVVDPAVAQVHVELRLGDGTTNTFHIGELIPAELIVSTDKPANVWISMEDCDSQEVYPVATPPGGLAMRKVISGLDGLQICTGHGWGKTVDLAKTPYIVKFLLNRRYQLDTPGVYPLNWTGSKFGQTVTSNTVDLKLLPRDPTWEAQELAKALKLLDAQSTAPDGCEILKYLSTSEADVEIAKRYARDNRCGQNLDGVLIRAWGNDPAFRALSDGITEKNVEVTMDYLRVLSYMSLFRSHPEWWPTTDLNPRGVPLAEQVGPLWRPSLLRAEELGYAHLLTEALPAKDPTVRALCAMMLLEMAQRNSEFSASDLATVRVQMQGVIRHLSAQNQEYVQRSLWPELASPALIPWLEELINSGSPVAGPTLRNLYALDPSKARTYILEDLNREKPNFPAEELSLLPDGPLPQFDASLLERVQANVAQQNIGLQESVSLVVRYGSPAIAPQIQEILETKYAVLPCDVRIDLMAFVAKTNPRIVEEMAPKMDLNGKNNPCNMHAVAQRMWSPYIESLEVQNLDSKNSTTVTYALRDLQQYGSESVRPIILQHFKQWNAAQVGQEETKRDPEAVRSELFLGPLDLNYFNALTQGYNWLATQDDLKAAGDLCVTPRCKDYAKARLESYKNEYAFLNFSYGRDGTAPFSYGLAPSGTIGDLARIQHKISEYPPGTHFRIDARFKTNTAVQKVFDTLGVWMTAHGYTLSSYTEAGR